MNHEPVVRIAILWSHLSGYLNACLRQCARRDIQLFASWLRPADSAPFNNTPFEWLRTSNSREWVNSKSIDAADLIAALEVFQPQMILISGWNHSGYRTIAKHFAGRTTRILCMDNPWEERPKQWLGRLVAPWYVQPLFDGALVAGERQFQFARRLGFRDRQILVGVYAPDAEAFHCPSTSSNSSRSGFLYVGRLVQEKGISVLAEGYLKYRSETSTPWPLTVAGCGPLEHLLNGIAGVTIKGFVQPIDLPSLMHANACLVVPSLQEPWGMQISEGTTAGMAIVATTACGATPHLVRHGHNGFVIPPADSDALAVAMHRIAEIQSSCVMSSASEQLARQFTPNLWVDNLLAWNAQL